MAVSPIGPGPVVRPPPHAAFAVAGEAPGTAAPGHDDALVRAPPQTTNAKAPTTTPAASAVAMGLNHFFVTLDAATHAAIGSSRFLKEQFGVFESRTTRRGDLAYTGLYFYGDNTYLELFNKADKLPLPPYGVAFGVDREGDAKKVAPTIGEGLVTRFLGDQEIPWFKMGTLPIEQSKILIEWMMEYVPEFLARWNPQTGTPAGVSRAAVLARYAAALGETQQTKLFEDITALSITATQAELDHFLRMAKDFGCTTLRTPNGAIARTRHEELRLTVGTETRITAAHFKLRRFTPAQELHIGSTTLTLRPDGTATWTF